MKREKKQVLFIELDKARKERLLQAKNILARGSMSALAIEAIDEKLDRVARQFPELHRRKFKPEADAA